MVFISYPAGHDVSSYWPLLLSSTQSPTMLLVPSVQLKFAAFLRAHSPLSAYRSFGAVWHRSASSLHSVADDQVVLLVAGACSPAALTRLEPASMTWPDMP